MRDVSRGNPPSPRPPDGDPAPRGPAPTHRCDGLSGADRETPFDVRIAQGIQGSVGAGADLRGRGQFYVLHLKNGLSTLWKEKSLWREGLNSGTLVRVFTHAGRDASEFLTHASNF